MRLIGLSILFILNICWSFGQQNAPLLVNPVYHGETLQLGKNYTEANGDWIEFSTLRFYLSDLTYYSKGKSRVDPVKSYLVDLENPESLEIRIFQDKIDSVSFNIGVDSLTNVSGILEGDLDPIKGMYWTWNSGYINFKLEGKCSQSSSLDKSFEFHLGGYLHPYETLQNVVLAYSTRDEKYIINLEIEKFLVKLDLKSRSSVMIPGKDAKELSEILPELFEINDYEK